MNKSLEMAAKIVEYESRRDKDGHIILYEIPSGDGGDINGQRYEYAGINGYHENAIKHIKKLVSEKKHKEAEEFSIGYIAKYTEIIADMTSRKDVEFFLRDCAFNRGPTGAIKIYQMALGVKPDGIVGPITRAAIEEKENDPEFILEIRKARESYEREEVKRSEKSKYWKGLVNRWNKAYQDAPKFL